MRILLLFVLIFSFALPLQAQKKTKPAAAAAKTNVKPDNLTITENEVFAKVGKVKVKVPYYSVWNNGHAALNRKKEFMYFLFEKFTPKQVKRIVELAEHRSVYSSRYEDIKYVMTGYLVTYGRYYENPNWDNWKNYALLYLPYSENSKGEVEEWWAPKTKEGTFVLAEYGHLEYADGTPRKGTEKWAEKPFTDIAGYTSDWEDILKADQPDLNTVNAQTPSETPGANSKDPAVAAFATAFGKVIQQGLNGIDQTNYMVDAIEKALDGSAKGSGDAVNENALKYYRDIRNAFSTATDAFDKVKSGLADMDERSISAKCSGYYNITKAKNKVSSAITDILSEKNLLNTYISLCKIEYMNRTYYSLWKDNIQKLRTRYITYMQEYVRRAHEGLKELKSATQTCIGSYIK